MALMERQTRDLKLVGRKNSWQVTLKGLKIGCREKAKRGLREGSLNPAAQIVLTEPQTRHLQWSA